MFKLAKVPTVEWPVTVNIPQDGGRTVKSTFTGIFEVLEQDEIDELSANGGDILKRTLRGWKGVAGDDGAEIAFEMTRTEDGEVVLGTAVLRFLKIPYVRAALWAAFGELQSGRAAARKN